MRKLRHSEVNYLGQGWTTAVCTRKHAIVLPLNFYKLVYSFFLIMYISDGECLKDREVKEDKSLVITSQRKPKLTFLCYTYIPFLKKIKFR